MSFHLGDQLIVVCESNLQVWSHQNDENDNRSNRVNFELDSSEISGRLPQQGPTKTWKSVWSYK